MGILLGIALGAVPAAEAQDFGRDLPAIQAIEFVGNESIDSEALLAQTMLEFPSLSHPLRPRPRFRRNTFGRELRLVEDYYRLNGFGGVEARLDSVIVLPPRNDVRLRVRIREGPRAPPTNPPAPAPAPVHPEIPSKACGCSPSPSAPSAMAPQELQAALSSSPLQQRFIEPSVSILNDLSSTCNGFDVRGLETGSERCRARARNPGILLFETKHL